MGKASLIYVIGLSFIVAYAMLNINASGTAAMKNYTDYYVRTMSRNIASSGANIGCADLFLNPSYNTPYNNISFQNGKMNIWFVVAGNSKFVYSSGTVTVGPVTIRDTVIAELRNTTLAKYAWFTNLEANKGGQTMTWSTWDTAWGPVHTNDKFNINGSPAFMKKATAKYSAVPKKNDALWAGGYEWGITIPYPTSLDDFKNAATTGGRSVWGNDAKLNFINDGTIRLRVPATGYDSTFANAAAFSANGAFVVIGANLTVEGGVTGDLAVGAVPVVPGWPGGKVTITGDITYNWDPRIYPTSTDKLGIYAYGDITVKYDNSSPSDYYNRKVDASIFSLTGVFEAQDAKLYPPRGQLTTYGAMLQYKRGEIGEVNPGTGTLLNGYSKNFKYDKRLETSPPKFFPSMGRYTLYAWREN